MKREARYVVLKLKDLEAAGIDGVKLSILSSILDEVLNYRRAAGKQDLNCVVVESDWPEYEAVWKMIEARVDGQ